MEKVITTVLLVLNAYTVFSDFTFPLEIVPTDPSLNHKEMLKGGAYFLFWKYDDKKITFEVHCKTYGFVAFGLSPDGGMEKSDIVIGGVSDDGKSYFKDYYATGETTPTLDKKQSWTLVSSKEDNTFTVLQFSRMLDTCDKAQDRIITSDTIHIIWSYGSTDTIEYHHLNRGAIKAHLLKANIPDTYVSPSAPNLDLTMGTNFVVPKTKAPWVCKGFKIPPSKQNSYITGFAPMIHPGHEKLIQSMVIRFCHVDVGNFIDGKIIDCFDNSEPTFSNFTNGCKTRAYVYGKGAKPLIFPSHVGFGPLTPANNINAFKLDVFYDNKEEIEGIKDNSGVNILLSNTKPKNEAAVLMTGFNSAKFLFIPPYYESFIASAGCPSITTKAIFPAPIKMFASGFYMHSAGRAGKLRHIRNGRELKPIMHDENFQPDFVQSQLLNKEVTINPGDELVTECKFNTMNRNFVTEGGFTPTNEMCFSFSWFYPKPAGDRVVCLRSAIPQDLVKIADVNIQLVLNGSYGFIFQRPELYATSPPKLAGKTWNDALKYQMANSWDNKKVRVRYQAIFRSAKQIIAATSSYGPFPSHGSTQGPVNITTPYYTQVSAQCLKASTTVKVKGDGNGVHGINIIVLFITFFTSFLPWA